MKIKTFILILTIVAAINCVIAPVLPFFFNKTTIPVPNPPNPSSGPISINDFFSTDPRNVTEPSNPPTPNPFPYPQPTTPTTTTTSTNNFPSDFFKPKVAGPSNPPTPNPFPYYPQPTTPTTTTTSTNNFPSDFFKPKVAGPSNPPTPNPFPY